jgi:glycosyltransferase involved in cell wall biosynthesis
MILAIVPAYNEADHIGSVVSDLQEVVDEVVVVNDCSVDDTVAIALEAGATVLSHNINRGAGAALETGHAYARAIGASYVVHFDGDGQFTATEIPLALAALKRANADVLFGSRFLHGNGKDLPWSKRYIIHPEPFYTTRTRIHVIRNHQWDLWMHPFPSIYPKCHTKKWIV